MVKRTYGLTLVGATLAITLYCYIIFFKIDLFEQIVYLMGQFEEFELDEVIPPLSILIIFIFADLLKKRRDQKIEVEKVKVYRAMLSSTYHVLNNFLNQMFLFKLTAEHTDGFPPEVLDKYDEIIADAKAQLKSLGEVSDLDENSIISSVHDRSARVSDETSS